MKNKQIIFNVELARPTKVKQGVPPTVFTNDTNTVEFIFNVTDLEVPETATAEVNIFMRDGSFFQKDALVEGSEIRYTLSDTEGKHAGMAQIQMTLSYENKRYSTSIFQFKIDSGLNDKVAVEVLIQDWDTITTEARQYLEQLADYGTEFSEIIADARAQVDANVVEGAVENKFNALEAEYAQDITSLKQSDISLTAQLQQTEQSLNAQLAQKLTQGIGAVTNADLSQEVKESMTGGSVAVVGENAVLTENIVNQAVTMKKTNFIKTVNLFNKDVAISGGYMNFDGTVTSSSSWHYSEFIPVESNETYIVNDGVSNISAILYDANKQYLDAVWAPSGVTTFQTRTFTINNANAKYMVINVATNKLDKVMLVEGTVLPTEYAPFGQIYINNNEISHKKYVDDINQNLSTKLTDLSTKTPKSSDNLFNKDTAISGGYMGADGVVVSSSNWYYSDFIEVGSGETYTANDGLANIGAILYDSNQNFLEAVYADGDVTMSQVRTFTVDNAQAKYMVVNITINKIDTAMVVEGNSLPAEYIPYGGIYIMGKAMADKSYVEQKLTEIGTTSSLDGTNVYMNYSDSFIEGGQEFNTAIGFEALAIGGNTKYATAVGYQAMKNNKPDGTKDTGLYNTAVGYQAMTANVVGDHNTAVGFCALKDNLASYNTACGEDSLFFNTTGDSNSGLGVYSLKSNTTGRGNTAAGVNALTHNTTGSWNSALGENAGVKTYSGVGNCDTDTGMTFLGAMASVDKSVNSGPFNNSTAVGRSAKVNKSNMVKLGSSSTEVVETNGDYEILNVGKGLVLKSPNGTRFRIGVSDTGEITTTQL